MAQSFYDHCVVQMTLIPEAVKSLVENAYACDKEAKETFAHRIAQFSFNAGALSMSAGLPKDAGYDLTPPIMNAFLAGDYRSCWDLMTFAGRTILNNIEIQRISQQARNLSLERLGSMDLSSGC